ncbi:hypothetical protein ACVME8_006573 [Bradyrhizobium diazoefficiens]
MFEINGFDTAGVVSLKRLSLEAALKKPESSSRTGAGTFRSLIQPAGYTPRSRSRPPSRPAFPFQKSPSHRIALRELLALP